MTVQRGLTPLSRNRNYNILWSSQLCSELAVELVTVALPLLVLSSSGSALQMGFVASALAAAHMIAVIPAGVIADRWNRRTVMLVCQVARAVAMTGLVAALLLGGYAYPLVLLLVVVEGLLGSVFDPAEHASLPQVVPESLLSKAVARNAARPFVATLLGPAAAGLLFTLHPVTPFVADVVVLALSAVALVFLHLPDSHDRSEPDRQPVRGAVVEGLRWVLGNRRIRASMVWQMVTNLVFNAVVVVALAMSNENQVGPGELGLMMACLGAGGLLGAFVAARLHSALSAPVIILGFSWLVTGAVALMAVVPTGLPLGVLLGLAALFAPLANTTVLTSQFTATPDRLRGRLSGITGFCTVGAAAVGPAVGGVLMTVTSGQAIPILVCAASFGLIALGTTFSPTLRRYTP